MEVVDGTKLIIGVIFAIVGVAVLVLARGRGFTQQRQAGALFLVGAIVFSAVGLGLIDL
jgi:hypothetical protein